MSPNLLYPTEHKHKMDGTRSWIFLAAWQHQLDDQKKYVDLGCRHGYEYVADRQLGGYQHRPNV